MPTTTEYSWPVLITVRFFMSSINLPEILKVRHVPSKDHVKGKKSPRYRISNNGIFFLIGTITSIFVPQHNLSCSLTDTVLFYTQTDTSILQMPPPALHICPEISSL